MPPPVPRGITFGGHVVDRQVFTLTSKSFGIVNLRPLLPGHVLVCPRRSVARLSQLSPEEVSDLFLTVSSVSKTIEKVYGADALNIAVQDGPLAGQSIPHVHCHIIPRRMGDLPNVDDVYKLLNKNDIEGAHKLMRDSDRSFDVDDSQRENRTIEDMEAEATKIREYLITSPNPHL